MNVLLPALAALQLARPAAAQRADLVGGAGRRTRLQAHARKLKQNAGLGDIYLGLAEDNAPRHLQDEGSMPPGEMCSFCPDGLADPSFILPTADGATCGTAQAFADTLAPADAMCATVKLAEGLCCPPTPATLPAAIDESTEAACASIVDIAVADDNFSTLVAAVTAAGLVDALSGEGPLTVFAPTNDAFAALEEGTVEALLEDPEGALTEILTYHVVPAEALSSSLVTGDVPTLSGDSVAVTVSDDGVMVNDANVVAADVIACNGVIHVIDKVLFPPADPEPTTTAAPDTTVAAADETTVPAEPTTLPEIVEPTTLPEVEPTALPEVEPTTLPEMTDPTDYPINIPIYTEAPETPDDGWSGPGFGSKSAKGSKGAKGVKGDAKTHKHPMAKTHKESTADESSSADSKSGKALVDMDAKAKKVSGSEKSKAGKLMKEQMSMDAKSGKGGKASHAKTMKPEYEAIVDSWEGGTQ